MGMPGFAHGYDFDPGYNMDLAQLLAIDAPLPPADFADFWLQRHAAARALSPCPRLTSINSPYPHHTLFDLRYTSTDAAEIGGWLLVPTHEQVRRGVVFGHCRKHRICCL